MARTISSSFALIGLLAVVVGLISLASGSPADPHDPAERTKIRAFLSAMTRGGASIDNIDVKLTENMGRGLFAARPIKKNEVVFSIPEKLWLGSRLVRSLEVTDQVRSKSWLDRLVTALLSEYHNPSSLWKTWFELIPTREQFETPMFWTPAELEELQASHAKYFTLHRLKNVRETYKAIFENAKPASANLQWMKTVTLEDVQWALSIIWSRNFAVGEKESAVVPIADFMNMQRPAMVSEPMVRAVVRNGVLTYSASRDIDEGEEILAPYGVLRPIPNVELLNDFGFVWDGNLYDAIPFKLEIKPNDADKEQKEKLRNTLGCTAPIIGIYQERVPNELLCAARIIHMNREELSIALKDPAEYKDKPISSRNDRAMLKWIRNEAKRMIRAYGTTVDFDRSLLATEINPRLITAITLRKREKEILQWLANWAKDERAKLAKPAATAAPKDEL